METCPKFNMRVLIKQMYKILCARLEYILPGLLCIPNLIWIFTTSQHWGWDESDYGFDSLLLWKTLTNDLSEWLKLMVTILPEKTPMFVWLGQFSSPLGMLFNSYDRGFLFFLVIIQYFILYLLYKINLKIFSSRLIAVTGSVIIAAGNVFIAYSGSFFSELLSALLVVCLLYFLTHMDDLDLPLSCLLVLLLSLCVVLTKISAPVYSIITICVILFYVIKKKGCPLKWPHYLLIGLNFLILLFGIFWFYNSVRHMLEFSWWSAFVSLWGAESGFLHKLGYWCTECTRAMVNPFLSVYVYGLLFLAVFLGRKNIYKKTGIILIPLSQTLLVLIVFSMATNQVVRFLVPLLPYFVILFCWTLAYSGKRLITVAVLCIFVFQLFYNYHAKFHEYGLPANVLKREKYEKEYEEISKIASYIKKGRIVIGAEIATTSILYYSLKHDNYHPEILYFFAGNYVHSFGPLNIYNYWNRLMSERPQYYLTRRDLKFESNGNDYYSIRGRAMVLLSRMLVKSRFYKEVPLQIDADLALYEFKP
jgi:hypothetical protein